MDDLSILFGGKAGIVGIVEHPHVDDQVALMRCIEELRVQTEQLSLRVGTHEEVGNASADHLTSALRRATQKNVINVQVNTRLLWKAEDTIYFSIIYELSNAIKIYCTHIGSSC